MICRLWHGWTAAENADAYEAYLTEELFPRLGRELGGRGYRGFHILRREDGSEVGFVTMTWFESLRSEERRVGKECRL